jgi:ABC-type phosphate/phosphonate transport system substrate-binding protein
MRDTDLGWMTKIVAVSAGPISTLADLKNRTLALGSRDSGHAAILPVHFLEQQGMIEGRDYRTLRFDSDLGKHGDTGTSEVEVVRAVLDGRADAGAIGSPFWNTVRSERLVPEGGLREIWSSPPYNHCMFTARPDLDPERERRFVDALSYELRQPGTSPYTRCRRTSALANASRRWLRRIAAGRRPAGILRAGIG